MSYCYKIVLDNFFEARSASWEEEVLTDQTISSPDQGVAPHPWEFQFPAEPFFEDRIQTVHVPHTDIIKTCNSCCGTNCFLFAFLGSGRSICSTCKGIGSFSCNKCHGDIPV